MVEDSLKKIQVKPELLLNASSVNRFSSGSVLIKDDGNVAAVFGTGHQVGIWNCKDPQRQDPLTLLRGHKAPVTVIKVLKNDRPGVVGFVSGDSKGEVLVWASDRIEEVDHSFGLSRWKVLTRLTDHHRSISSLASTQLPDGDGCLETKNILKYLVVAGASDGGLFSWRLTLDTSSVTPTVATVELIQKIDLGNLIALDISLSFFYQSDDAVLAVGATNSKIGIYSISLPLLQFEFCFHLPGHTDWVRCVDFVQEPSQPNHLLLVSGSQDHYIRMWKCFRQAENKHKPQPVVLLKSKDPFESLKELTQTLIEEGKIVEKSKTSSSSSRQVVEMKKYDIPNTNRSFASEAVLYGHEGWVTNVRWCFDLDNSLQLISTSADRSIIIWRPSETSGGIWLNSERFGELGASTNLGYFGAHYFIDLTKSSETILASGWTGAWHRWGRNEKTLWQPQVAPTGHYRPVTGLDWDRESGYLLSCSSDQTSRLWGLWSQTSVDFNSPGFVSWHELARPQVHGHDLCGAVFVGDRRTRFISISEEKVMRAFEMTGDFLQTLRNLSITQAPFEDCGKPRVQRATVPPLGLSNRIEDSSNTLECQGPLAQQTCPPFEDQLLSRTLWPEVEKIYAHPSELASIAASHCGKIVASACHASSPETAIIRLHSGVDGFQPIDHGLLQAHQLTVTSLSFSSDDKRLLSVSRDRSWAVWKRKASGFELEERFEKAHARIIWDSCWAPMGLGTFVTCSRDKLAKFWTKSEGEKSWSLTQTIKFDQPVTSCAMEMLLAIGLEGGEIRLYSGIVQADWKAIRFLDLKTEPSIDSLFHSGPVNKLTFEPHRKSHEESISNRQQIKLASGGEDGVVKIIKLELIYD
ncbi:WD40-repeat-containing domain protein [Phakopsora pachyrhizi]|nr:WD40-repeat-containing domain protein [Phakopsora pachyrhizi]